MDAGVASDALDRLEAAGFIDDAAFARAWVDSRRRSRGLSRSRLRRELVGRGIPIDCADAALREVDDVAERTAAEDLARRWVDRHGLTGDRDRARLFAHLARRGYSPETADSAIREISRAGD